MNNLTYSHFEDKNVLLKAIQLSANIIIWDETVDILFQEKSWKIKDLVNFILSINKINPLIINTLNKTIDFELTLNLIAFLLSSKDFIYIWIWNVIVNIMIGSSNNMFIANDDVEIWEKCYRINKVEEAIENKNIVMYFQPIVNSKWEIITYESLVRLKDWDKIILPWEFLEYIAGTNTMKRLSEYIVSMVCEYLLVNPFNFSINLTENDLLDEYFINLLIEKAKFCNENWMWGKIIIEVLENVTWKNDDILKNIKKLRENNILVAIDDFWVWQSNLLRFLNLWVDIIKLDKSLVRWVLQYPNALDIIKSIVNSAHEKWLNVVAEYIEDENIFNILKDICVDYFQWYYFWKPQKLPDPIKLFWIKDDMIVLKK